jgi:hypothetical protein
MADAQQLRQRIRTAKDREADATRRAQRAEADAKQWEERFDRWEDWRAFEALDLSIPPAEAARRLRAAEAKAVRLEGSLRDAPMPIRESVLDNDDWHESYEEWWHDHASEAAIAGEDDGEGQ